MSFPFDQQNALIVHTIFECMAYVVGMKIYITLRERDTPPDGVLYDFDSKASLYLLIGLTLGALIGSKSLSTLQLWPEFGFLKALLSGKTIVGGMIGGWIGVEVSKKYLGIKTSTGDGFVIPLCIGLIVGRIGCFLAGLYDGTIGIASHLPWAYDFGDGIPRHPMQVYEILALAFFAILAWRRKGVLPNGILFRLFIVYYMTFRIFADLLKPDPKLIGSFSVIQIAAFFTVCWACISMYKLYLHQPEISQGS